MHAVLDVPFIYMTFSATDFVRVIIRPGFPGHVLFFRLQNCVWGGVFNFTKMSEFLAFVDSHTQFFLWSLRML
jgi:hypothetical protein